MPQWEKTTFNDSTKNLLVTIHTVHSVCCIPYLYSFSCYSLFRETVVFTVIFTDVFTDVSSDVFSDVFLDLQNRTHAQ